MLTGAAAGAIGDRNISHRIKALVTALENAAAHNKGIGVKGSRASQHNLLGSAMS
ncbi:MAG: hypothetical protein ACNYPI_01450 [Arenicellales bacterium WSBS_2016_MAG_OTU3]